MNESKIEKPWTRKHMREARARSYELAAILTRECDDEGARRLGDDPFVYDEEAWRGYLAGALKPELIEREVKRVRGLAEGRLVRETGWRVERPSGSSMFFLDRDAATTAAGALGSMVESTRIRRAR